MEVAAVGGEDGVLGLADVFEDGMSAVCDFEEGALVGNFWFDIIFFDGDLCHGGGPIPFAEALRDVVEFCEIFLGEGDEFLDNIFFEVDEIL